MVVRQGIIDKKKTQRRVMIIDEIMELLKSDIIFKTINYKKQWEKEIKQYMHRPLIDRLKEIHQKLSPGLSEQTLKRKAKGSLLWEGDVNTTVNNFLFLGVQHRPDFVVQIDKLRIAVEVKKGEAGGAVREGLGQSLVYASEFDFVCYIFVDTSKDKKVVRAIQGSSEQFFIQKLWNDFNIRFDVV